MPPVPTFRPMIAALLWLVAGAVVLATASPAAAAVVFSLRTGKDSTKTQSMVIDSNQCPTAGPTAMYVGGLLTNNGASAVTNIVATMSGLGNGFALAGGQAATQSIGALGAGESTGVYWFVSYGCANLAATSPMITVTSSIGTSTTTLTLTGRTAISANAGGNVLSSTLGPGAVVGQTIYFDTSYDFGGTVANDEYFLQPAGGPNFNAGCFRLVGSEITGSNLNGIAVGAKNQLYFIQPNRQSGNGYTASVRYYFQYLCEATSTVARPYAVQTSGNTNIKYTGNFDGTGSISISFPGATNPFTISKTATPTAGDIGTPTNVTYTVTITNPSPHTTYISSFTDTLPPGATYVGLSAASGVTVANSSSVPAAGATGTVTFVGKQDQSYLLAGGASVSLVYNVTIPAAAGTYTNSAKANFGTASTPTATATVNVSAPSLTIVKTVASYDRTGLGAISVPGNGVIYTFTVTNTGGRPDNGSVVLIDPIPTTLSFDNTDFDGAGAGTTAFGFTANNSGLACCAAANVAFSSRTTGSPNFNYTPSAGVDAAVRHIRVTPTGRMAAGSSFQVQFRAVIK
jgi:fimbrial isopeptide formation D2 family protein/uncharacterized repeat protein (TIGR01451 family)